MIGLGIDTGGTCTDAVIYDLSQERLLASAKAPTTHEDLKIGIRNALEKLPADLLASCGTLSLSTTLATNACVERKWGNARLVLIGADESAVTSSWNKYGYDSPDDIYLLRCRLTPTPGACSEPDWEQFEKDMCDFAKDCSCISVVQLFAMEYHGRHEKTAADIIRKHYDIPVIMGHSLFPERNILRRGAGALLNARLIPVIYEFLGAVRQVLTDLGLDLPLLIMRSDGSLMSSEYTSLHPVETLLCGPAASTKGALSLTNEKEAVVVDMGGTTTDISIIRDGDPLLIEGGIQIADWKTFVKGLYVDTFALGGDTEVHFDASGALALGVRRVLPLAMLASMYPGVTEKLQNTEGPGTPYPVPIHEFFLLLKKPGTDSALTDTERNICHALENGPLSRQELADAVRRDIYTLNTERLESSGILIRSGITPTDIMHIRKDFCAYDRQASIAGASLMAGALKITLDELCQTVYTLVQKRLYCSLVRIFLDSRYSLFQGGSPDPQITSLIEQSFDDALLEKNNFFAARFFSDAVLIGIGAPTHLFLEPVARMLHTRAVIPKDASVANAIGAVAGNITASASVQIRPDSAAYENFRVTTHDQTAVFSEYDEALAFARRAAGEAAEKLLLEKGGKPPFSENETRGRQEAMVDGSALFLSETVTVTKTGKA
jgi:N-methylhydantoinase A/oxoprolinase/acetone carboxylase beta subunit